MLTPSQEKAISDPAEFVSMLVARRSGKTFTCVVKCLEVGFTTEFGDIIYIALTKKQAKDIVWPTFKKFNDKFDLGLKFNETLSEITFPGQTKIRLFGGDRLAEIDRLRGQSFDLCVIDEGKSYKPWTLKELIDDVIDPGLGDRFGQLFLIGTPGHIYSGPFYEATTGINKGFGFHEQFSFHTWALEDNTAMPHLWERALKKKDQKGWSDTDSSWVREYLGRWCVDEKLFVLNFDDTHTYSELPKDNYRSILGCKFTARGEFYLCVLSYSDSSPTLYHRYDFVDVDLSLTEISNVIKDVTQKYGPFMARVAITDEYSRTLLDRFNMKYRFALKPVNTEDTRSLVELANTDFRDNRVKILDSSRLVREELPFLQWHDKEKQKFGDGLQSGITECFLHSWKQAYHHFAKPEVPGLSKDDPEYWNAWEELQFESAVKEQKAKRRRSTKNVWFKELITKRPRWVQTRK